MSNNIQYPTHTENLEKEKIRQYHRGKFIIYLVSAPIWSLLIGIVLGLIVFFAGIGADVDGDNILATVSVGVVSWFISAFIVFFSLWFYHLYKWLTIEDD